MSLSLLLSETSSKNDACHQRATPQSATAESYLSDLSRSWCNTFPYDSEVPAYISASFRAYGDYMPQGISYSELMALTHSNVAKHPHLKFTVEEVFAGADSKARRADVYLMTCIHGYEETGAIEVRRPGVTVLRWHRRGEMWECYEHIGIKGVYGVFDDP